MQDQTHIGMNTSSDNRCQSLPDDLFLIDSTFLLKTSTETFLEAPLLSDQRGHDHTFTYGVIRAILRLRKELGIRRAIIIVGRESIAEASEAGVTDLIELLTQLKVTVLRYDVVPVMDICALYSKTARWIVTTNWAMSQLTSQKLGVLLPRQNDVLEVVTTKSLSDLGIRPDQVPAMIALSGGSSAPFNKSKSIRLLEVFGNLEALIEATSCGPPTDWKRKLAICKNDMLQKASEIQVKSAGQLTQLQEVNEVFIDDCNESAEVLRRFGFWSLVRLLPLPDAVNHEASGCSESQLEYMSIRTADDFLRLEECLSHAKLCAIDTETSGKDPRIATLFGISLAVEEGQAFFIPMIQADIDGIFLDEVRSRLNKALTTMKMVGHNLKYDFNVLRRHGIELQTFYFDTMLAAYDCFGDWEFWNLAAIAKKLLGISVKRYRDVVSKGETFLDIPSKEMVKHACSDVDITLRLHRVLMQELQKREILECFFSKTMEVERLLLDLEKNGIRIDKNSLSNVLDAVSKSVDALREAAFATSGTEFDIDSPKTAAEVFHQRGIWPNATHPPTNSQLEVLALQHPLAAHMVKYRREKKRHRELNALFSASITEFVYPIFSQIKTHHGGVTSISPCLNEAITVGDIVDIDILKIYGNADAALNILCSVSGDPFLQHDLLNRIEMSENFAGVADEVPCSEFLLAFLLEESDLVISHHFLISKNSVFAIRKAIVSRYQFLFSWIEACKRSILSSGFLEYEGKRKYIEGLRSSDIARRNKAVTASIRWLARY